MQNHLVQNLCCLVGLPNFGAESLLSRKAPPSRDAEGGEVDGFTFGDLALIIRIPRADLRSHARTQRKHKHETRFPGWGILDGFTPKTSDPWYLGGKDVFDGQTHVIRQWGWKEKMSPLSAKSLRTPTM